MALVIALNHLDELDLDQLAVNEELFLCAVSESRLWRVQIYSSIFLAFSRKPHLLYLLSPMPIRSEAGLSIPRRAYYTP